MAYNTLGDLTHSLRFYVGNDGTPQKANAVRRAALSAFRYLLRYAKWSYYVTWGRIYTTPAYLTGTVAFDFTGGAYERVLTISGGTWPTWAAAGSAILDTTIYDVEAYKSPTQITLPATQNPGADATFDSFQLVQTLYDMPGDFLGGDQLVCAQTNSLLMVFSPRDFVFARSFREGPSQPREFTFVGGRSKKGVMSLALYPPPDAAYPMDFLYRRQPKVPILEEEKAGTVSLTGAAVTGVGTNFNATHVGTVMRFSATAQVPTAIDSINPPVFESRVAAVADEANLTLEDTSGVGLARVGYTLSDQVDVEIGPMWDLLIELARKSLRIELRMNMTNEELDQYTMAVAAARSVEGQRNSTRTIAGMKRPDQRYSEYPTRTDWGN